VTFEHDARDQPLLRLAGMKRALGPDRVIAGALDAQLDRPGCARAAVGDLVGSGQCQRDLLRRHGFKQAALASNAR
jgi:hypothetical protein